MQRRGFDPPLRRIVPEITLSERVETEVQCVLTCISSHGLKDKGIHVLDG